MNARQKAKEYKKKIKALKSDNDLMREIIADSPAMQELYDAYNKPKFVTQTTMQFQEFRVRRTITVPHIKDLDGFIERTKPAFEKALLEEIKENITYEVDDKDIAPIITASILVGRK
jgi:hypothetical protein